MYYTDFFLSIPPPADIRPSEPVHPVVVEFTVACVRKLRTPPTPAVGFPSAGLPSSCAELSERAMSLSPVPSGVPRNGFGASVSASAIMTRLATGCLSVGSIEAYIRDFTFVWLIRSSGWASALRSRTRLRALRVAFGEVPSERRSPFCGASPHSQPSYQRAILFVE